MVKDISFVKLLLPIFQNLGFLFIIELQLFLCTYMYVYKHIYIHIYMYTHIPESPPSVLWEWGLLLDLLVLCVCVCVCVLLELNSGLCICKGDALLLSHTSNSPSPFFLLWLFLS
jgi:hypothetical protein